MNKRPDAGARTEQNVFTGEDARNVIRYIGETYQDEPEFLWQRFPNNAILRRKDTKNGMLHCL